MTNMKKYRVYVNLSNRISTEVLAPDADSAKAQIDSLDFHDAMRHICGREWDCWETSGGVAKVREIVQSIGEYEVCPDKGK